ncbi:MAG: hypothetical protein RL175_172 [Pseudomonadota bacterium]
MVCGKRVSINWRKNYLNNSSILGLGHWLPKLQMTLAKLLSSWVIASNLIGLELNMPIELLVYSNNCTGILFKLS